VRALALLLLLASGFGLAALWQSRRLEAMRSEHEAAARVAEGDLSETESGLIPAGSGVVLIGRPSGASPLEGATDDAPEVTDAGQFEHPELPDFELEIRSGQTLSSIAEAHYSNKSLALVQALAEYNGLEDPDLLSPGDRIFLPQIEKLDLAATER
jgi:nucleoid-associated protein YgaU